MQVCSDIYNFRLILSAVKDMGYSAQNKGMSCGDGARDRRSPCFSGTNKCSNRLCGFRLALSVRGGSQEAEKDYDLIEVCPNKVVETPSI